MKHAIVFSIEEFAIHDGPGIRTTIFLKGCPLKCVWCHNPEGISPEPQYMYKKGEKSVCGRSISTQELAAVILKNKDIYTHNQGGITLTGGEPLMQSGFVMELLQLLPGIHKAMETSGYVSASIFEKVIPMLDLVLFDVKHTDAGMHKKYTGKDNKLILRNLEYLCSGETDFIIRVPLIPGVNDTKENMLALLSRIKGAPGLKRVELLKYHKTAGAKYAMIGEEYDPPFDTTIPPRVFDVFTEQGIETLVIGN